MATVKAVSDVSAQQMGDEAPGVAMRVMVSANDGAPNFALRVFSVEPGGHTPYHAHAWEHEVFVLEGQGVVVGESGEQALAADQAVYVQPDEKHCFRNTGEGVFRFICVIPLESKCCGR